MSRVTCYSIKTTGNTGRKQELNTKKLIITNMLKHTHRSRILKRDSTVSCDHAIILDQFRRSWAAWKRGNFNSWLRNSNWYYRRDTWCIACTCIGQDRWRWWSRACRHWRENFCPRVELEFLHIISICFTWCWK